MYSNLRQAIEDLGSASFMRAPVRQAKDEARVALAAFQREPLAPALREASIVLGERLEDVQIHQPAFGWEPLLRAWNAVEQEALGAGVQWRRAPARTGPARGGDLMTETRFCPGCGTPRLGAFRWCRSCQLDFDTMTDPAARPNQTSVLPVAAPPPSSKPVAVPAAPIQYLGMLPSTRDGILAVWLGLVVVGWAWILASNDFAAASVLGLVWFCVVTVPIGLIALVWQGVRQAQVKVELERRLKGRK